MSIHRAICGYVEDGDTFRTVKGINIRLARIQVPEQRTIDAGIAKTALQNLIEGNEITYEQVGVSNGKIMAEVWIGSQSVNDYIRSQSYK